jgi:hypothetical protein
VFENRVLWRIFGPKGDEMVGGWRKLHNEELRNLYSWPRRMRWAGHIARMERRAHVRYSQKYLVFGIFPSSGILDNRKHNVSGTENVSVFR